MSDSADKPRAYAGSSALDRRAIARAYAWARAQQAAVGGQILLHIPQKQSIPREPAVAALARSLPVATWRAAHPSGWGAGPVISLWPDRAHLAGIDERAATRALVVVSWNDADVTAWLSAHNPTELAPAPAAGPGISDPVVIEGLTTLTVLVNHGNNLTGSMDKRDAVNVLMLLRRNGHLLEPDAIYAWALAHPRWQARGAERLRELAQTIAAGGRPRAGNASALRADALARWRDAAAGS